MKRSILFIFICFVLKSSNSIKINTGFNFKERWDFIHKFCFNSNGSISFSVKYPNRYNYGQLVIYKDRIPSSAWKDPNNACLQLNHTNTSNIIIPELNHTTPCLSDDDDSVDSFFCAFGRMDLITVLPICLYLAISHCNSFTFSSKNVRIHTEFLNSYTGDDVFRNQFSSDHIGLFEASIFFSLAYIIILTLTLIASARLRSLHLNNLIYILFVHSVIFSLVHHLAHLIFWSVLSATGTFIGYFKYSGEIFYIISEGFLIIAVCFLSIGYKVFHNTFFKHMYVHFATTIIYEILFIAALFSYWEPWAYSFYGFVVTRVCYGFRTGFFVGWFTFSTIFTIKKNRERRKLYIHILISFFLWFIATQIAVESGVKYLKPYEQENIITIIRDSIVFIGHVNVLIFTFPTSTNQIFTNDVAVDEMNLTPEKTSVESAHSKDLSHFESPDHSNNKETKVDKNNASNFNHDGIKGEHFDNTNNNHSKEIDVNPTTDIRSIESKFIFPSAAINN